MQVDNNKIPKPDRTTSIRKLLKSFVSQNVSTELKEDTQTEMKSVFVIKSAFKTPFRNLDDKAYQEDMLKIDKKVADEAFKNNKRTLDDYKYSIIFNVFEHFANQFPNNTVEFMPVEK